MLDTSNQNLAMAGKNVVVVIIFVHRCHGCYCHHESRPLLCSKPAHGLVVIDAGMVLFYLIRMEPFTAMNRNLQGGRFDHADRLFSNVAATWDNCLHSSSDVKELTPEFYHQPEFLLNSNEFELGTQQVQSNFKS